MLKQYLEVGKVTNAHGIMGEVRVQPWCDSPEFLCQFDTLYVDAPHVPYRWSVPAPTRTWSSSSWRASPT